MNRLHTELHRLYAASPSGAPQTALTPIDAHGHTRALVLELAHPADWPATARLWQGVQADLDWPAPALAVSGDDGFLVCLSLAEAVPLAQAEACLTALRDRYWAQLPPDRVGLYPMASSDGTTGPQHAPTVPAEARTPGRWSAFVAPGLAELFADDPWLDLPPSPDAQADLLAPLLSVTPAQWRRGLAQLGVGRTDATQPQPGATPTDGGSGHACDTSPGPDQGISPQAFLLSVVRDPQAPLALRIEAAKALLPHHPN